MNDPFEPQQETPAEGIPAEETLGEEAAQAESSVDSEYEVSGLAAVEGITLDETALPVVTDEAPDVTDVVPVEVDDALVTEEVSVVTEESLFAETAEQAKETDVAAVDTSLEEIVPAEVASAEIVAVATGARLAWWPFLLLVGLWVALAGAAAYVLTRNTELPAFEHEYYPAIVLAGVVLTLVGPVLAVITWAVSPKEGERGGLFVTSIMRASVVTLFGVIMWWGVLVAVDALRLGLIKL